MARHPSAALRVVLAWLLAAGPLPTSAFADVPEIPPTQGEPGASFLVLKVGTGVVPTYGSVMIRAQALQGIQAGQEREVDALFPTAMNNLGRVSVFGWFTVPVTAYHYEVTAKAEKVKVKLEKAGRDLRSGEWKLARGGTYLAGTYKGCVPNGNEQCFSAIRGIARSFDVKATRVQPPATTPSPRPTPAPAPTPGQPPAGDFAGPWEWRSVPINDSREGTLHRKCKKAECACSGDSCKDKRITLYVVGRAEKVEKDLTLHLQPDTDYYLTHKNGGYNVCWVSNGRASVPVPYLRGMGEDKFLPDAIYYDKQAGKPADFRGIAKLTVRWQTGEVVAAEPGEEACGYSAAPGEPAPPAPDPILDKLKELLGEDKGALALARVARHVWEGEPSFEQALTAALEAAKTDKDKAKADFLQLAQTQVLRDTTKSANFIKTDAALKADFKEAYCKPADTPPPAAVQQSSTAMQQAGVMRTDPGSADGRAATPVAAPQGSPYAQLCSLLEDAPGSQPPTSPGTGPVPPPGEGREMPGNITQDKNDPAKAEAEAKAKKLKVDLQRAAIGGMGGALVLGVFGFIFGGPIGAIAMGAIGFGVMAGVSYLNNNPIK